MIILGIFTFLVNFLIKKNILKKKEAQNAKREYWSILIKGAKNAIFRIFSIFLKTFLAPQMIKIHFHQTC